MSYVKPKNTIIDKKRENQNVENLFEITLIGRKIIGKNRLFSHPIPA